MSDQKSKFKYAVEVQRCDIDIIVPWNSRTTGSYVFKQLNRTPLMLAAMSGNIKVVTCILKTNRVDINRTVDTNRLSALDCAYCYSSSSELQEVSIGEHEKRVLICDEDTRKLYDDESYSDGWENLTNNFMMFDYASQPIANPIFSYNQAHGSGSIQANDLANYTVHGTRFGQNQAQHFEQFHVNNGGRQFQQLPGANQRQARPSRGMNFQPYDSANQSPKFF
ncbi:unnamed protein product [Ilex paraguariensis]|uniref:ANK_REP_REGION domain-containing protein n=1 Tax=Ilex paraguariensis TaxID=185542 RepID=A0ABC8R4Q4_9AQUA